MIQSKNKKMEKHMKPEREANYTANFNGVTFNYQIETYTHNLFKSIMSKHKEGLESRQKLIVEVIFQEINSWAFNFNHEKWVNSIRLCEIITIITKPKSNYSASLCNCCRK